jgi:hypothetical protein
MRFGRKKLAYLLDGRNFVEGIMVGSEMRDCGGTEELEEVLMFGSSQSFTLMDHQVLGSHIL